MFRDYYEVRDWLESFIPLVYGKEELGLARIEYLLKLLGNPERKFKSVHIAGTSGKGSTAFYTAKLLQWVSESVSQKIGESVNQNHRNTEIPNHRIGLHVSPHLVDIRERMQIFRSGKWKVESGKFEDSLMSMDRFIRLMNEVKAVVEKIQRTKPELTPSYFEILVAASFKYFAEEKVDWAVVEVGLGGRLDATNVLQPELTVITNVGLDHTEILGKTVEKIAWEKAGIIKSKVSKVPKGDKPGLNELQTGFGVKMGIPVITAARGKALKVIEKVAKEKGAEVIKVDTQKLSKELSIKYFSDGPFLAYEAVKQLGLSFYSSSLSSKSRGKLSREVSSKNILVSKVGSRPFDKLRARTIIKKVFSETFPGRFEEIDRGVILDGAHNPDKIRFLIRLIKKTFDIKHLTFDKEKKKSMVNGQWSIVLILAFKKGKNWKEIIDILMKNLPVKKVIATKFWASTDMGKFQAVEPEEIAEYIRIKNYEIRIKDKENSQEAVFEAVSLAPSTPGVKGAYTPGVSLSLILVTGSLYLVGEVRTMWELPSFSGKAGFGGRAGILSIFAA